MSGKVLPFQSRFMLATHWCCVREMNLAWIDRDQPVFSDWLNHQVPQVLRQWFARYPFLNLGVRTVLLLCMFVALKHLVEVFGALPAEAYTQPVLAIELLGRVSAYVAIAMICLTLALLRFGALFTRWEAFDEHTILRRFIVFLAFILAWPLATMSYNHFFDQGYYLDRLLLVLCLPLIWWRPLFILPFCFLAMAVLWQTMEPSIAGASHIPHKRQLLLVLEMFGAAVVLRATLGIKGMDTFWLLVCCLVAAVYWQPGFAKLELDWINHGHLYRMLLAAHAHGWLSFVDPTSVVAFTKMLSPLDLVMGVFVLVIEAGCLLFLLHRSVSIVLLVCVMTFHLGVFALYGFLFWTWILLDAALLFVLLTSSIGRPGGIFRPGHLVISVVLIFFAERWCEPPSLAWLDTRLSYTYRYTAIGDSGTEYEVPNQFFGAYQDSFTMAPFGYLVDEHRGLVNPYGITTRWKRSEALANALLPAQVFAAENSAGAETYNADQERAFVDFLDTYVNHYNATGSRGTLIASLRPPNQFWSSPRGNPYTGQEPIREISVHEVTTLYDEKTLSPIRNIELYRLKITPASG